MIAKLPLPRLVAIAIAFAAFSKCVISDLNTSTSQRPLEVPVTGVASNAAAIQ
jgi:hypothetical protein